MSIFPPHDIESMNEDDVAGELVRPLCRALGYSQGNPDANLRSQVSLQYDKAFLGHKNPGKDPVLRGRPDFVCEVVSYTRWVVEAKKPSIQLSQDDSNQAHTYATHPEIAAEFYMLTNGREFRLYRIAKPDTPALVWQKEETDELMPALKNFLGPQAMKKRADVKIDLGKPLAEGFGSNANVVGGHVVYVKNTATFANNLGMDGLVNTVTGNRLYRTEDGLIAGELTLKSAFADMDALFEGFGFYPLRFKTAEEYLSRDREAPTLMQGLFTVEMLPGMKLPKTPLSPGGILPIKVSATAYTEVLGFLDGDQFKGTFTFNCDYDIPQGRMFGFNGDLNLLTEGRFEIKLG